MKLPVLLLLAITPSQVVLVDEEVVVQAGQVKSVNVDLEQKPAVVETAFEVIQGGPVAVSFIGGEGRARRYVRRVVDRRSGSIRYAARRLGSYQVVLDNRQAGQGWVRVKLRVALTFDSEGLARPGTVPPRRRWAVLALSLLFLFVVGTYSGRKLRAAIEKRRRDGQLPLF
ncbi:MAG: hypothetical protein GY953_10660 [bacterium]|nr:hypothetical protein [bacterium]